MLDLLVRFMHTSSFEARLDLRVCDTRRREKPAVRVVADGLGGRVDHRVYLAVRVVLARTSAAGCKPCCAQLREHIAAMDGGCDRRSRGTFVVRARRLGLIRLRVEGRQTLLAHRGR